MEYWSGGVMEGRRCWVSGVRCQDKERFLVSGQMEWSVGVVE